RQPHEKRLGRDEVPAGQAEVEVGDHGPVGEDRDQRQVREGEEGEQRIAAAPAPSTGREPLRGERGQGTVRVRRPSCRGDLEIDAHRAPSASGPGLGRPPGWTIAFMESGTAEERVSACSVSSRPKWWVTIASTSTRPLEMSAMAVGQVCE